VPLRFLADVTGGVAIVDPQSAADIVKKITAAGR
jgi:hypothetical protein